MAPPDEHGFCSFGLEVGVTKTAAAHARVVIAEVNPRMPRTLGDSFIHLSKITHIVPVEYELPELPMGQPTELTKQIGKQNVIVRDHDHQGIFQSGLTGARSIVNERGRRWYLP